MNVNLENDHQMKSKFIIEWETYISCVSLQLVLMTSECLWRSICEAARGALNCKTLLDGVLGFWQKCCFLRQLLVEKDGGGRKHTTGLLLAWWTCYCLAGKLADDPLTLGMEGTCIITHKKNMWPISTNENSAYLHLPTYLWCCMLHCAILNYKDTNHFIVEAVCPFHLVRHFHHVPLWHKWCDWDDND